MGYLTDRKLILRFKGLLSDPQSLPGGGGMGTILELWLFLLSINMAGPPASHNQRHEQIVLPVNKKKQITQQKIKWIDDLTLGQGVDLRINCEQIPEDELTRPLNFHKRTEQRLITEHNLMQAQIDELQTHAREHSMVINKKKTTAMLFNSSTKYDLVPQLSLNDGTKPSW